MLPEDRQSARFELVTSRGQRCRLTSLCRSLTNSAHPSRGTLCIDAAHLRKQHPVASVKPLQNQAEGISPEKQKDATKSLLVVQSERKATNDGSGNSTAVKTAVNAKDEKPTDDKTGVSTPTVEEKQEDGSGNDDANDEQIEVTTSSGGCSEDGRGSRRSIVDRGLDRTSYTSQDASRRVKKARVLPSENLVGGGGVRNVRIPSSPHSLK